MAPESSDKRDLSSGRIRTDLWGYAVHSSSDDCIAFLNKYYIQVLSYGRDKRVILEAADADRSCALACGLAAAYLWAPRKAKTMAPKALVYLTAARANLDSASDYERLVVRALIASIERDWKVALEREYEILAKYPRDLVALKRAQTLCFNMGWSEDMLKLASQALPANVESAYMLGMLAFALAEVGRFLEAESTARVALTIEARDVWAQHAICHALEYQCRFKEALVFMNRCCTSWITCCSFMREHNWWHMATCLLELGDSRATNMVLALYDEHIWRARIGSNNPQKYINALGLLLRLTIRVHSSTVDHRILQAVSSLKESALDHQELLLNVLSVWAFGHVGQLEEANENLKVVSWRLQALEGHKQEDLQFAISLAAALYEYTRGNCGAVVDSLGSSFDAGKLKLLGASNEQLDVFEEMWCISSLRAGDITQVIQAADKLTTRRPGISFTWRVLAEAHAKDGQIDKAISAGTKAMLVELAAEKDLVDITNELHGTSALKPSLSDASELKVLQRTEGRE